MRWLSTGAVLGLAALALAGGAAAELPERDVHALFDAAEAAGRVGVARKTRPVDARPARPGEVVVTVILGEGVETRSRPAEPGDRVVRNRCPETGNEEYLVAAATFAERYAGPVGEADSEGWQEFHPQGPALRFFILTEAEGSFTFKAPWGEAMVAHPADAIVRDPENPGDTYRVAAASFACTYEIIEAPVGG